MMAKKPQLYYRLKARIKELEEKAEKHRPAFERLRGIVEAAEKEIASFQAMLDEEDGKKDEAEGELTVEAPPSLELEGDG